MKMKKIISAIAALAMTVSAFAGITAQAATETVYFIGSADGVETFDNYTGEGWSSTIGSFSSAASGNNHFGLATITDVEKPAVGESISGTYPSYVSGTVLSSQLRGKSTKATTYTMSDAVRNGKVYFETDVYASSTYLNSSANIIFYDSTGAKVALTSVDFAKETPIYLKNSSTTLDKTSTSMKYRENKAGMGYHIGLVFDIDAQTIAMSADYINTEGVRTVYTGEAKSCAIGNIASFAIEIVGPASSNNFRQALDNVKLYAETVLTEATETSVTINKVDTDGNEISTETVSGMVVGDPYVATAEQRASFYKLGDGVKYVYTYTETGSTASIDALSETAEDNVITLVFEKAGKSPVTSATVNYNYNGETILTETKVLSNVYVDDVVPVGFKRYILVDGVLYEAPNNGTNGFYRNNVTLSAETVMDITVSKETAISAAGEIVALVEGSGNSADNTDIRASEGEATRGTITVGTVEAGSYKIYNRSYRRGGDTWVKLDGTVVTALNVHSGSWGDGDVTNVQIPTSGVLTVGPGSSSSDYVDYVVVVKTGEYEAAPALTSEAQFAEQEDATGTLRFKSMVSDKDFESSNYGFILVNFADADADTTTPDEYDETATGITQKNVDFAGDVATDSVFYHDIQNIPNTATGMGFYAVPYVISAEGNLECYYGSPFTYTGAFNWSTAE